MPTDQTTAERLLEAATALAAQPSVWLVVMDRGGIFGAYLVEALAHQMAQTIGGVVVQLPVTADYRHRITRGEAAREPS